jgi:hypothetical protein
MAGQTVRLVGKRQRDTAHQLIEVAPDGAVLNIRQATRTTEQNDKMWALLSDISRAKPEGRTKTPEVWKAMFLHALGHAVQFEQGLNGEPFPVGFRTSRLNKQQMSDLIETIYEYGARHGVEWSEE